MRQLLIVVLIVAVGYLLSRLLFPKRRIRQPSTPVAEEMVRDPVCQLYLPRSEALRRTIQGRQHFFCSPGCLDKFLARRS